MEKNESSRIYWWFRQSIILLCLLRFFEKKYKGENVYTFYPKGNYDHNGLEINKWFKVQMKSPFWVMILGYLLYYGSRVLRKLRFPIPFIRENLNGKEDVLFHEGWWQDKKYVAELQGKIDFNDFPISNKNQKFLELIKNSNSVCIHIRRGDYLKALDLYGNICTEEYYIHALNLIKKQVVDPVFFVFSDDLDYSKKILSSENAYFVDCNRGANSFFDMFLMSHCKYMILANSTFSYWAAVLNKNSILVLCPPKWTNYQNPDIILENWLKINV